MQVNVSGRHANLSPEVKDYAVGRIEQLGRYFDRITNVDIIIDHENNNNLVEMVAHVGHTSPLVAKHSAEGLMLAVDAAYEKLERQILKLKDRLRSKRMHYGAGPSAPNEPREDEENLFEGEAEFEKQL